VSYQSGVSLNNLKVSLVSLRKSLLPHYSALVEFRIIFKLVLISRISCMTIGKAYKLPMLHLQCKDSGSRFTNIVCTFIVRKLYCFI